MQKPGRKSGKKYPPAKLPTVLNQLKKLNLNHSLKIRTRKSRQGFYYLVLHLQTNGKSLYENIKPKPLISGKPRDRERDEIVVHSVAKIRNQKEPLYLTRQWETEGDEIAASKYFGENDPIGQQMEIGEEGSFIVSAILKNLPENSHLEFDFLISYTEDRRIGIPSNQPYWLLLLLKFRVLRV